MSSGFSTMRVTYAPCQHEPKHDYRQRGECVAQAAQSRKRVKRVVSSGQVPHLWFHKVQDSAKNSNGSLYFDGPTIFSYGSHFPIARHVQSGKKSAVLFAEKDYSVTTSGHKSAVRSAIPEGMSIFHVPEVFQEDRYASNDHARNLVSYVERVAQHLAKSARARQSYSKKWEHDRAVVLREEARAYAKFFRLKLPKIAPIPALDSREMDAIKVKEATKSAEKAAQERIRKAEAAKREAELADKWRAGEYDGYFHNSSVMLRIRGEEIETSRGARVPVSHALRGLRFVREVVKHGEAFQTNGHTFHLGHYKIDRIDVDGTLHAGCHVIPYPEIERIAPELEVLAASNLA